MRKRIVAGNWKMNTNLQEGIALATEINKMIKSGALTNHDVEIVIAPPFTHLSAINAAIDAGLITLAAQNCASESKGAYTGEVSAAMLQSIGVRAVIIGHSERRSYYKEDDATLLKKVRLVLEHGMRPIFCCGELLPERQSAKHFDVVRQQIENVVFQLSSDDFRRVVIAYEPVWAIGTGVTATPEQAQEMHAFIRSLVVKKFGDDIAEETTIQYGGSCNAQNAKELFANADVDGGLIGGASLKAADFITIVNSF